MFGFAKEFYSSNFEDAALCFSTVTNRPMKRSTALLLHTNSFSSAGALPLIAVSAFHLTAQLLQR